MSQLCVYPSQTVCIRIFILRLMPQTLHRFYRAGELHFITFSCYQRQALLGTESRRDLFAQSLEPVRRRYRLVVLGYVVMPEHVHLLVSEPQRENLSVVIQALKLGFIRASDSLIPKRFWQARFYDFNVWTERKRVEKITLHPSQSGEERFG